jgi:hypothetical protein
LLISKQRAVTAAAILVVATAAITAIAASKWNLFAPKDYEECSERAAKDAKSKDALSVLLSICRADFEGRRKAGGGYTYYDTCQSRTFDIKGPNPSPDEMKYMKMQCSAYLDEEARAAERAESERRAQRAAQARQLQAAQEARARQVQAAEEARARRLQEEQEARARQVQAAEEARRAMELKKDSVTRNIHAALTNFECREFQWHADTKDKWATTGYQGTGYQTCNDEWPWIDMKVKVTNGSKEAVSRVIVGLALVPAIGAACPSTYAEKHSLDINLSPGETRETKIERVDHAFKRSRFCLKALDVRFAGE